MASNFIGGGVWTPANDSSEPHTHVSENSAAIKAPQPPASNSGSEDPTGGISKDAGGVSSTAGIGSPVTAEAERQTYVSSVLEYAFGKKERTAAETDAAGPTSESVTTATEPAHTSDHSGTYLGAIAAAGGAAVASIIPGMASTTGAEPHAATTSSTATDSKAVAAEPVAASTTPADVKSTSAATEPHSDTTTSKSSTSATTGDKTLGEKAAEATESAKTTASETAQSAANTASAAGQSAKEAVTGDEKKEEKEEDPEAKEKAKKVSDHEAAVRENKDAIPTAGGEKLGAAHAVSVLELRAG